MNDSVFITFLLTAVALLVIGGFFYCHHERRLQDIESQGCNRSNRSVLLSIERFVKIIAIAAVLFCTGVAIHYCCVFFPRYTSDAANKAYYENFGVDYWGIVVGFMALLVTLLVGWQIYSTIKTKEELQQFQSGKDSIESDIANHKKEISKMVSDVRGEMLSNNMLIRHELLLVSPVFTSAYKNPLERFIDNLDAYSKCEDKHFIAKCLAEEYCLLCLKVVGEIDNKEAKKQAIQKIKNECDKKAIESLYVSFLKLEETEKIKYGNINEAFLELLKD